MKNKLTENEILKYINDYFAILDKNFDSCVIKKMSYDSIFDIMQDLCGLFNEYYLLNYRNCADLVIKKYIPLLNMLIKIDKKSENNIVYIDNIHNAYRMASRISLEHYFIYREWDERDKFFAPRYKIMQGYVHYLQEIATNPKFELLIANMPSGYGKEIADFEPVLTKNGWKKHGDLVIGDYVASPRGNFVKVNEIHPKIISNRKVTFEDGEIIVCHARHEWLVYDRHISGNRIVETDYLMEHLKEKDGRNRFSLPKKDVLQGVKRDLPVDPYTYGVWLGDGSSYQGCITENIEDMNTIINYITYTSSSSHKGVSDKVKRWLFPNLISDLHKLGLGYKNVKKFIHEDYLTASIDQRLELLAGMIDTDGSLAKDKGNRYIYTTTNEKLRDGIITLVNSFGWRTSVTTTQPCISSSGIIGRNPIYYIGFSPDFAIPCKLKRKQISTFAKQRKIGIANVEIDNNKYQGNCITVEGGLYLVGKTLKVTHNSYPAKVSEAWNFGQDDTQTVAYICSNEDVVKGGSRTVIDEIKSEHFGEVFPNLKWSEEDKNFFLKETDGNWKLRNCKLPASYYAKTSMANAVGYRASQRIHIDDLYADYKEAMNQELSKYYFNKYLTGWRARFVQNKIPKFVVTGTLWASGDFIALIIADAKKTHTFHKHPKYPFTFVSEDGTIAIVQVPALDYETGLSVCPELKTTAEILKDKNRMEEYLFQTNFQQIPTDPEALFFSYSKLRTYDVIPKTDYIGTYSVIDATRKSGKDFFSMPIFTKVSNENGFDYYLKDCIFTRTATKDMYEAICNKIIQNHVIELVIESNVTSELKQNIDNILKQNNVNYCIIREKYNCENKAARIETEKGNILRELVFPNKNLFGANTDIGKFMDNLTLYNSDGRNPNDDAPDSCGMMTHEVIDGGSLPTKVKPIYRPF